MPENLERKELVEKEEEKKKKLPFWKTLNPVVLIIGAVLIMLIIYSMMQDSEGSGSYLFWLIGIVAVLYFLGQTQVAEEPMINPRDAELYVERECRRKQVWGQAPMMAQFSVDFVSDLHHKDARGVHYTLGIRMDDPFGPTKYYHGKVMPKGIERGFTTFIEPLTRVTGRELPDEKSILPEWANTVKQYPMFKDIFMRKDRFG